MSYARRIDPDNPDDLFQEGWVAVRQLELKNPRLKITDPPAYFYRVLVSIVSHRNKFQREPLSPNLSEPAIELLGTEAPCEAFLIEWCEQKVDNELHKFYRNMVTLVLKCKTVTEAINMTAMDRKDFYRHLKAAKQQLINDFRTSDNHDLHRFPLV